MKDGFLLINKYAEWTSRDICNKIQHKFHFDKIGHNGTLDPFASGLLLIAFGDATKLLSFMENDTKTYIAKLILGKKTATGDKTGDIIEEQKFNGIGKEKVEEILSSLIGPQKQVPPMTSAIHVNGQKLYHLAHQGITVERKERDIYIYELKYLSYEGNVLTFLARVSKGTYIRTLGETIAEKTGNVGYLENLERVQIGDFKISNSKTIDDVSEEDFLDMFSVIKEYMPIKSFSDEETLKKVIHGGKLSLKLFPDKKEQYCVTDEQNNVLAVYQLKENEYYYCARNLK